MLHPDAEDGDGSTLEWPPQTRHADQTRHTLFVSLGLGFASSVSPSAMTGQSKLTKDAYAYIWAHSLIRSAESAHHKAVLAHTVFKVPIRACAKRFGMDGHSVERALAAFKEGRELGVNGRPRTFSAAEEAEIAAYVLRVADIHESIAPTELLDIVRCFSLDICALDKEERL
jgi:hypothetical protein